MIRLITKNIFKKSIKSKQLKRNKEIRKQTENMPQIIQKQDRNEKEKESQQKQGK